MREGSVLTGRLARFVPRKRPWRDGDEVILRKGRYHPDGVVRALIIVKVYVLDTQHPVEFKPFCEVRCFVPDNRRN